MTKDTRTYNQEKTISSINGVGKTGQLHANECTTVLHRTQKQTQNALTDLNITPENIKHLEEKHRQ